MKLTIVFENKLQTNAWAPLDLFPMNPLPPPGCDDDQIQW